MDLTEYYKQQLQEANLQLKAKALEIEKLQSQLRNADSIIADQDAEIDSLLSRNNPHSEQV